MATYKKVRGSVEEQREYEQLLADSQKMQADLMYVAMMSDVDLDEGEDEEAE